MDTLGRLGPSNIHIDLTQSMTKKKNYIDTSNDF